MSNRKNTFADLFSKFGYILNNYKETENYLEVDQRIFQSNLSNYIQKTPDNPIGNKNLENLKLFLTDYLEDETNFLISLLPTKNNPDLISHSSFQDTLLKVLLELDQLQSHLFDCLIEKVVHYTELNEQNGDVKILNLLINVPCYIINHFKYQPRIKQPEELCKKLLQLIDGVSSIIIKKEIILCFPDILCDSDPNSLAPDFENLISSTELLSATLEALSNLRFNSENSNKLVDKVFDSYSTAQETDLPSLIKFILKTCSNLKCKHILNKLRTKIQLDEFENKDNLYLCFDILKEYFIISNHLIDLYETILNDFLTQANQTNEAKPIKLDSIDLILISIIYSIPQQFKQIDKLFKSLIKHHLFMQKHLEKSILTLFKHGKCFLNDLFEPISILCKSLIQNQFEYINSIGKLILKLGFDSFDKKLKSDLIYLLIDLITGSIGPSKDNSLDILVDLAATNSPNPLCSYSIQIKSLMEHIDYFSLNQIRKVYFIICSVAYSIQKPLQESEVSTISSSLPNKSLEKSYITTNSIQDNLHILINKQLSSNTLKYKQIGVIGALMMLKNMANKTEKNTSIIKKDLDESEDYFSCSSSPMVQNLPSNSTVIQNGSFALSNLNTEVKNIWYMILDSSKSSPESLGLFEDDLSSILYKNSINDNLEFLIKENLKDMTKNLFKLDLNYKSNLTKFKSQLEQFKFGYEFGIDEHTVGALNLLPLVLNDMQKKNSVLLEVGSSINKNSVIPSIAIPSTFRLMCSLERKNLLELKDYIGVPILSLSKDDLYKFGNHGLDSGLISMGSSLYTKFKHQFNDDEKKLVCNSIFLIINWFTEIINAFSAKILNQDGFTDVIPKLVNRLNHICDLQQVLSNLLPCMKFYRPPMVFFGLIDSSIDELPFVHQLIKSNTKPKSKNVSKRKGKIDAKKKVKKIKKEEEELNESEIDEVENTLVDDEEEEENEEIAEIDLNKISIYFREFDLSLINFLTLDLDFNPNIIPDSSSSQSLSVKIKPNHLFFILNDFNNKLSHILKTNQSKLPLLSSNSNKPSKIQLYFQLNEIEPSKLINGLINHNLDSIYTHLNQIYLHLNKIKVKNDGIKDSSELINNKTNILILKCLNQLIKLLNFIYQWLSSNTSETSLIEKSFRKLAQILKQKTNNQPSEIIFINYMFQFKEIILDLNTANLLVKFLDLIINKIVSDRQKNADFKSKMCEICTEFLFSDFNSKLNSTFCSRQASNEAIVNMLLNLIRNEENSIDLVKDLVNVIRSDDFRIDRNECGKYSTLKYHFLSYYKVLIEYTVQELKFSEKFNAVQFQDKKEFIKNHLKTIVDIHTGLIILKKYKEFKDINLLTIIKNSRLFVNNFMKYSMVCFDHIFSDFTQECIQIFDNIQNSVHYIQEILVTNSQTAVSKQAPVYMRSIEALIVRLRQVLYINNFKGEFKVNLFEDKLKMGAGTNKLKKAVSTKKVKKAKTSKPNKKGAEKSIVKGSDIESEVENQEINDEEDVEEDEEIDDE